MNEADNKYIDAIQAANTKWIGSINRTLMGTILIGAAFCIFMTGSIFSAVEKIDKLEEYINDVEMYRSQDRDELDSLKEDLCG